MSTSSVEGVSKLVSASIELSMATDLRRRPHLRDAAVDDDEAPVAVRHVWPQESCDAVLAAIADATRGVQQQSAKESARFPPEFGCPVLMNGGLSEK